MTAHTKSYGARGALLCCVSALALGGATAVLTQGAYAQGVSDGSQEPLEEIKVTGTRVRGAAPVGYSVTALGRDELETSGEVTIDRMLKEIPQVYDLGISESSRGQAGGAGNIVYGNSVNLRGVGPYATLVLIDGHRVVSNTRHIDPSVLPSLGVERIEVLADGASAIYGSDGIAGIVNLIPRRNLDGVETFGRYGFADQSSFDEFVAGAAFGQVWDSGQFMVAYEHAKRSNLSGDDRDFFVSDQRPFGGQDYRVMTCNPGTIQLPDGTTYAIPAGGVTQASAGGLTAGTANLCDDQRGQDLFPSQTYDTMNATVTQDVNDWLTVFADGFFSERSFRRYGGYSSGVLAVPSSNAFFVRPAGFTGNSYNVQYSFMDDLPNTVITGMSRSWQVTPGIRAQLPYDWELEAKFAYGKTNDQSNSYDGLDNRGDLAAALASSDPNTAFDPYGLGRTSSTVLGAIADQIFLAPTLNTFTGGEIGVNGPLFQGPGGDISLAAGYEYQRDSASLGSARGNPGTPIGFRDFKRQVDSLYGELLVPVFGPENAVPGFQRLDLNAAIRYDDYSDVGHTTNPKLGVSWSPVSALTLRGNWGTSFRAPLISQIYGNSNAIYGQSYQNPLGGAPVIGYARSGPNVNLKPETATTWSVGADLDLADNIRLSATYFTVNYKNQVEAYLSDLSILSREAEFAGTGIIYRDAEAAAIVTQLINEEGLSVRGAPLPGGDPANVTLYVDGRNNNLGRSIMRGLDFKASYWIDTENSGTFTFDASGTYTTSYKVAITETAPLVDRLDQIYQPLKFRARGSVGWQLDPMVARVVAHYVGGYTNNAITPNEMVSAYTPIDLEFYYTFGDPESEDLIKNGFTLGLSVSNVFDSGPPYVNIAPSGNGGGGYDPSVANPVGRMFSLTVRKKW